MWWHTVTPGVGKWRENWRLDWVANTLHTNSERGLSSITTADAHNSAAYSRLNWRPRGFKWTRPFRRKTKSGFCACAITFQKQSTSPTWETELFPPTFVRGTLHSFVCLFVPVCLPLNWTWKDKNQTKRKNPSVEIILFPDKHKLRVHVSDLCKRNFPSSGMLRSVYW